MKPSLLLFLLLPVLALCQAGAPQPDIWLMQIDSKAGKVLFTEPRNLTNRPGYDNQPAYSRDGKLIYYTSQSDTSSKTTIYSYSLATGETRQVTYSVGSPFSAMPLPSGSGISVVMLEEDATQRIWQYPFSGSTPRPLFEKRDSVGYYAWVDAHSALAYILSGKSSPNRLSLIGIDGTEKKIAENVGRGMRVVQNGAFFIQNKNAESFLAWTDFKTAKQLVRVPGNSMDLAICKDYVLMASGGIMYGAKIKKSKGQTVSAEEFVALQNLSTYGLKNITRMDVSPDEKTITVAASL